MYVKKKVRPHYTLALKRQCTILQLTKSRQSKKKVIHLYFSFLVIFLRIYCLSAVVLYIFAVVVPYMATFCCGAPVLWCPCCDALSCAFAVPCVFAVVVPWACFCLGAMCFFYSALCLIWCPVLLNRVCIVVVPLNCPVALIGLHRQKWSRIQMCFKKSFNV